MLRPHPGRCPWCAQLGGAARRPGGLLLCAGTAARACGARDAHHRGAAEPGTRLLGGWGGGEGGKTLSPRERKEALGRRARELGRRAPEREAGGGCSLQRRPRGEHQAGKLRFVAGPGSGPLGVARRSPGRRLPAGGGNPGRRAQPRPVLSSREACGGCCTGWEPGKGRQDPGSAGGVCEGDAAGRGGGGGSGVWGPRAWVASGRQRSGRAGRAAVGAGSRGRAAAAPRRARP